MRLINKKFITITTLFIALSGLLFLLSSSSAMAAGCEKTETQSYFSSFLNPLSSLAEKIVKSFGYDVVLAAPVSCSSNGCAATCDAFCAGDGTSGVTISWQAAPVTYWNDPFFYYVLTIGGNTYTVPSTAGGWPPQAGNIGNPDIDNLYTISSGLSNNIPYNWSVEAYYYTSAAFPTSYYGGTDQPSGSFTTPNCVSPTNPPNPAADVTCPVGQAFMRLIDTGGTGLSQPVIESLSDGTLVVVVQGVDIGNNIWSRFYRSSDGADLTAWSLVNNGKTIARPKLVKEGSDIALYVIGTDNNIWKNILSASTKLWGGWTPLWLDASQFGAAGPSTVNNSVGTYRVPTGTYPMPIESCQPACTDNTWSPGADTICSGTSFTQTSNCGNTKLAIGTNPNSPPCSACTCSSFTNQGCAAGGCPTGKMWQTRDCNPDLCQAESQCVANISCQFPWIREIIPRF